MSVISRFASAFSLGPKVSAEDPKKETDEEKKSRRAADRARKAGESDEDYAKRCAELDDKEKAEDEKEKKDASAPAAPKTGEKDEEEKSAIARAEGMKAERARWGATLSDPRAKNRGVYACQLLDTTDMDSGAILATIATFPEQGSASDIDGLAARMEAVRAANPAPTPAGGKPGPLEGTAAHSASIISAAADKARGIVRK